MQIGVDFIDKCPRKCYAALITPVTSTNEHNATISAQLMTHSPGTVACKLFPDLQVTDLSKVSIMQSQYSFNTCNFVLSSYFFKLSISLFVCSAVSCHFILLSRWYHGWLHNNSPLSPAYYNTGWRLVSFTVGLSLSLLNRGAKVSTCLRLRWLCPWPSQQRLLTNQAHYECCRGTNRPAINNRPVAQGQSPQFRSNQQRASSTCQIRACVHDGCSALGRVMERIHCDYNLKDCWLKCQKDTVYHYRPDSLVLRKANSL